MTGKHLPLASVGIAAALAALLAIAVLAARDAVVFLDTQRWVEHTHQVIERLDRVLQAMVDGETGQRGYLLTGDASFLEPYRDSEQRVSAALAELRPLVSDNPEQLRRLDELEPLLRDRIAREADVLAVARQSGTAAAGERVHTSEGWRVMAECRRRIAEMQAVERRLLDEREADAEHGERTAVIIISGGAAAAFAVATIVGLSLLREARRRALAEDERDRFFSSALDLFCLADFTGKFTRVNPSFTRVLGWSQAELVSRPFVSFVHPDDVESTNREAGRLAAGAETVGFENRYRCKDGSWRWLMWSSSADTARGVIYAVARDITERKRMEDELRATEAQVSSALRDVHTYAQALERSNRELKEFAHVASHDLQEPLRMVSSYCAMLGETYRGKLGADADEMIGFATDGAKRMQVLIQDLLSYARVESRGVAPERLRLAEVAAEAIANVRGAIDEAGAEVVVGELPELVADRRLMVQLLQNLIGNGIKYRSETAPRVAIDARRVDGAWEIAVADNGIGIAPRHHERIFGMFKRLHGRDRYQGTGIGLAICKKIVELHGGRLRVESDLGKGATFLFTIPDAPPPPAATPASRSSTIPETVA